MDAQQIKAKYPSSQYRPVLITEITRMKEGYFCVAGMDIHSGKMVRPLQSSGKNWMIGGDRSVFAVGHLVDCISSGSGAQSTFPHATEDTLLAGMPQFLQCLDMETAYAMIAGGSKPNIESVFNAPLIDGKYLEEGTSSPSLGGVIIKNREVHFVPDGFASQKIKLGVHGHWIPVTCDRLQGLGSAQKANEWLFANGTNRSCILRIGLSRGWAGPNGDWVPKRCYMQLNGIIQP